MVPRGHVAASLKYSKNFNYLTLDRSIDGHFLENNNNKKKQLSFGLSPPPHAAGMHTNAKPAAVVVGMKFGGWLFVMIC